MLGEYSMILLAGKVRSKLSMLLLKYGFAQALFWQVFGNMQISIDHIASHIIIPMQIEIINPGLS